MILVMESSVTSGPAKAIWQRCRHLANQSFSIEHS
jgi:hypothetical protein